MFIAIINDSYVVIKEEIQDEKEDFEVEDYLRRGYNNIMVNDKTLFCCYWLCLTATPHPMDRAGR